MSTVALKMKSGTQKLQMGTAILAVAAAATITPTIAHATPNIAPFPQEIGASIASPLVSLAAPSPCATASLPLGCYAVEGFVAGTQAIVRGAVVYIGTAAYVVAAGTGQLFKLVGSILPGPIGGFFTNVGDGVSAFANNIAITFQVGPYQTAQ